MTKYIVEDTTLKNIADAIRAKNGETSEYLPSEMPAKIEAIEGGGSSGGGYEIKYRNNGVTSVGIEELKEDILEGKYIDAYEMFYSSGYSDFSFLNIGTLNLASDCTEMFANATSMEELDASNFNTSKVINMYNMFYFTKNLTELNASGWDTSNVTNMSRMFYSSGIKTLNASGWDTSNVTSISYMFYGTKLSSFDFLKNWDVSKVTNVSNAFYNNEYVTELDLSNWNLVKCSTFTNFIAGLTKMTKLRLPDLPLFKETSKCIWSNPLLYDIQFANNGAFGNGSTQATVTLNLAAFWQGDANTEIGEGTYGSYYEAFANSIGVNTSGYTRNIKLYTTLATSLSEEQIAILTDKGYTIITGTS